MSAGGTMGALNRQRVVSDRIVLCVEIKPRIFMGKEVFSEKSFFSFVKCKAENAE
jgi:hypothetical protein